MNKRGVFTKLLVLVSFSVLAFCVIGVFGINNSRQIYNSLNRVRASTDEFEQGVLRITNSLNELRHLSLALVLTSDIPVRESIASEQFTKSKELDEAFETWDLASRSQLEIETFQKLRASWIDYRAIKNITVASALEGQQDDSYSFVIQTEREQFDRVAERLKAWQNAIIESADNAERDAEDTYDRAWWLSLIVVGGLAVAIAGFGTAITKAIVRPINTLKNAASTIASRSSLVEIEQELDRRIEIGSQDEIGQLAGAFNKMVENLGAAMIRTTAEKNRTQAILNSTADGIVTIDAKGVVRNLNAAAASLLGYGPGEIEGKEVSKIVPTLRPTNFREFGEQPRVTDKVRTVRGESQTNAVDKRGHRVPIALRVNEMEYAGERLYIATLQGISVQVKAEHERNEIAAAIRDAVRRLAAVNERVSTITKQQASGANEQAAAASQSTRTVADFANTAKQTAERSDEMAKSARHANQSGQEGRAAVEDSIHAMALVKQQVESLAENILLLAERAQAIGAITETVKDIAEQTNVLALNAAVEASRAGEHGKGFAIVASEVKSLADQSKKATSKVSEILSEIQHATNRAVLSTEQGNRSVSEASRVVENAGETINALCDVLAESERTATKISASARHQATGVLQLDEGIRNISDVTQQNVASIRKIESSVQSLSDISGELASLTSSIDKRLNED